MAEFAGSSKRTRKYLLEGDDDKANRQDNSILEVETSNLFWYIFKSWRMLKVLEYNFNSQVRISMQLRQGDPLFKL